MKKVVIFGTEEFAQVASIYLMKDSPYKVAAFTVNERYIGEQKSLLGLPIVPFETLVETHPPTEYAMFVAVGFKRVNKARADVYHMCKGKGYELISYINSKAVHWGEIDIGDNVFVFEQNVIQPFVKIGNDVIIWSGNHIGHHSTIGDHCFIASHAVISGGVNIGAYSFIGVNATFRDHVVIGEENVIGASAVILKDTKPQAVHAAKHTDALEMLSSELKSFK